MSGNAPRTSGIKCRQTLCEDRWLPITAVELKIYLFNDRSNLAGQVAGYRTLFLKYRGATILGRLRHSSRFLNEWSAPKGIGDRKKSPASCGASSIRENRRQYCLLQGKMEAIRRKASGGRSHILAS